MSAWSRRRHRPRRRSGGGAVQLAGSTHRMWDAQLAALEQRFRVIRYDTRGHGDSPVPPGPYGIDDLADDLVALLDRLDVERAHLVGLSLGGMTGDASGGPQPGPRRPAGRCCAPAPSCHRRPAGLTAPRQSAPHGARAVAEAVVERWFTPELPAPPIPTSGSGTSGWSPPRLPRATQDAARRSRPWTCATSSRRSSRRPWRSPGPTTRRPLRPCCRRSRAAVKDGRLLVVPHAAHLANAEQPGIITPRPHRTSGAVMTLNKVVGIARRSSRRHPRRRQPGRRRVRPGGHPVVPHRGAAGAGRQRPDHRVATTAASTAPGWACCWKPAGSAGSSRPTSGRTRNSPGSTWPAS